MFFAAALYSFFDMFCANAPVLNERLVMARIAVMCDLFMMVFLMVDWSLRPTAAGRTNFCLRLLNDPVAKYLIPKALHR